MQAMPIRIFFILFILFLIHPSALQAAPEQRTALIIGNSTYSSGPLKNPVNDATDMAATLQKLGFTVILKKNANLETMEQAIEDFGNRLKRGGVGLFYYAGHGVQVNGVNYLIPIGAKINKESDVRFKAFDAGRVLAEMENANNGLNIMLLDACRDNPFGKSFRSASRGLAIVSSAPVGTFISYSTGPGQVARDGEERNSPYTKALLQYVQEPGLTIEDVFKGVRQKLRKETGQVPWELSSLEGKFYFRPGSVVESAPVTSTPVADDTAERRKVEEERELLRQRTALEEGKRKLEEEKRQLALLHSPAAQAVKEIDRDGRFIAYDNGTVLDMQKNLMWAAKDNKKQLLWKKAKSYCEDYRGGGYADWRMPTQDELAGLYEPDRKGRWKVTTLIDVPDDCWANETRGGEAAHFVFIHGGRGWKSQDYPGIGSAPGALPVRSLEVKKESRFIDNGNGTITDTQTNLMWAAKDNEDDINWQDAKSYCENYSGGGYTDWRMPTQDELAGLYDSRKGYNTKQRDFNVKLTDLIQLSTCCPWASETRGAAAAYFYFINGERGWNPKSYGRIFRALPVRFGK